MRYSARSARVGLAGLMRRRRLCRGDGFVKLCDFIPELSARSADAFANLAAAALPDAQYGTSRQRCTNVRSIAMRLPRRKFLHLAAGALPAVSRFAWAQGYPSRPVRIIAGFPAGGTADITVRLVGQWLSERIGQSLVIENRAGAGSNIATEAVVRAAPDGYTLFWATSANAINATLYDKLNYNFIRDILPITGAIRFPNVMEVNPSIPAKTVAEFIAYTKANPGKISYGSGGIGTTSHLSAELFKMIAGVDMLHVPYRMRLPRSLTYSAGRCK